MKLYFARHGHTDANADNAISEINGEIDEPLNDAGIQQANDLAEQLKDVHFDAIISSPLKRAYQTAEIVSKHRSLPVIADVVWREREIGAYVDLQTWNDLFDFDKNIHPKNVEDLREFFKRVYDAIDNMKRKYEGKTVLVVSHGGVHLALYAYANELPLSGNIRISPMKNCEYRIYEIH